MIDDGNRNMEQPAGAVAGMVERWRAKATEETEALRRALNNSPLAVSLAVALADLPADLAGRFKRFNAAATALDAEFAGLPGEWEKLGESFTGQTPAAKLVTEAARLRTRRVDGIRKVAVALEDRKAILADIVTVASEREAAARTDLEAARNKVHKALADAGLSAETRRGYQVNPAATKRVFELEVDRAAPVMEVQERLDAVVAARRRLADLLAYSDVDIAAVVAVAVEAFEKLL